MARRRAGRGAARPPDRTTCAAASASSARIATSSICAIGGLPARTHASQGEQRSLALALRLAAHQVVTVEAGTAPVLLLDDVFSELDGERSDALLAHLPAAQTILTTAGALPAGAAPARLLRVVGGTVSDA